MSYISRLAWIFLGLWLLGLAPAYGQEKMSPEKPWTGKLCDGRVITKTDLEQILENHRLWVKSDGKRGKRASLEKANLSEAELINAELSKAFLAGANLKKVDLGSSNLSEAILNQTNLEDANLESANLSGTILNNANLRGCHLSTANLFRANLDKADLSGAVMLHTDLSKADLSQAILTDVNLRDANLSEAIFEPRPGSLPDISRLIGMKGLPSIRYEKSSHALVDLREAYKKAGLRDQEREVTFALNHTRRIKAWEREAFMGKIGSLLNLICFEWTCDYGMTPGRLLIIIIVGLFVFTLSYLVALRSKNPTTGIWVILPSDRVLDRKMPDRPFKLTFRLPSPPFPEKRKRGY